MDKLNLFIKEKMFGFPYYAESLQSPSVSTPLATLNRVFLFGSGLLYSARVTQSSTSAPAATSGTIISAAEYDSGFSFTFTRTTTGSYKLAIAGLPSTADAKKVLVSFTTWANPLKVTGVTFTEAGVMEITFETIAGTDVFSAEMKVFYVN